MRMFKVWAGLGALSAVVSSIAMAADPPRDGSSSKTSTQPPPATVVVAKDGAAKKGLDLEGMLAFFDKLFPPQPDPDPTRLALARNSVNAMWPDGAYGKMMAGFMGGMFNRVLELKKSDLAALAPKDPKAGASSGKDLSLHDQEAAKDPYFDKRMEAVRQVIDEEFGKVSAIIDPRVRDGLARSMARRFDAKQLTDINAFFATPSGHALATQSMQLWVDPDMLRSLIGATPELMKLMPEAMEKMKAADERFPKPPSPPKETEPAPPKDTKAQ